MRAWSSIRCTDQCGAADHVIALKILRLVKCTCAFNNPLIEVTLDCRVVSCIHFLILPSSCHHLQEKSIEGGHTYFNCVRTLSQRISIDICDQEQDGFRQHNFKEMVQLVSTSPPTLNDYVKGLTHFQVHLYGGGGVYGFVRLWRFGFQRVSKLQTLGCILR